MSEFQKKFESRLTDPLRERFEQLQFIEMQWQKPRSTADMVAAAIQMDVRSTQAPSYVGLLDSTIKQRFFDERARAQRAFAQINPSREMLRLAQADYAASLIPAELGVSGNIFFSRKLMAEAKSGRPSGRNHDRARLSFSVQLSRYVDFFHLMMHELNHGQLADAAVQLKMANVMASDQGSGENAHLYFHASDEPTVYQALVDRIYPKMVNHQLNAVGGRFMMLPVVDKNGQCLEGVEFGQGMANRTTIDTKQRAELLKRHPQGLATSGVIDYFSSSLYWDPKMRSHFDRLHQLQHIKGNAALRTDTDYRDIVMAQRRLAIQLGRNPTYPILERNATEVFPQFTKQVYGH